MIFCAALNTRSVRLGAAAVPYFDTVCWQAFWGGGAKSFFPPVPSVGLSLCVGGANAHGETESKAEETS